jgi:hypothetical protein
MRMLTMATVMVIVPFAAHAQQSNFTGPNGQYQGSAFNNGRSTTFTDRNGRFAGSSITHGNKTDFFDARGRYQGTTTRGK